MQTLSATYSPDDDKLRLYSTARLDAATYVLVKDAGFRWAPKQELFVAPSWTPHRENLLLELCGEIGDEDTSLVARAEERADRFEGYSDKREQDAESARRGVDAVAKRFEFGQPILVGHHSERKARKDAERIENGMRRAVKLWETSQYWEQRAAGALQHAKHKERPDVRHRRIKTIEADKRKQERVIADAEKFLKAWNVDGLTLDQAKYIANGSFYSQCFPLAEYPREPPATQYEGPMGLWSALDGGVIGVEQARALCLRNYPATIEHARRWVQHYEHRIAYERAMLDEQGGLAGVQADLAVGGRVLVGGEWLVVLRVNKVEGRINSVTTNSRYVRVKGVEEVKDYRAPSPEDAVKVKAAVKTPPLCNYPDEGVVAITKAQWDQIPKDYKGTQLVKASDKVGRHRVRAAMGHFVLKGETDDNKRHSYPYVFITDAKRLDAPAAASGEAPSQVPAPVPDRTEARPVHHPRERNEFDVMREQLREGVKVLSAPQLFPTPPALAARMVDLAGLQPGMRVLEPSAGTGRLLNALPGVSFRGGSRQTYVEVVAVEVNASLAGMLESSGLAGTVRCADFLQCNGDLGTFDAVLMNPPFEGGSDIKHIRHALSMLKPGGRLIALCANGPRQNDALRPLVEERGGQWEDLPPDTFREEGTTVRAALIALTA